MTETPRDDKPKPARRPRIKLPFDNRREDMGSWTYDHRIGLCVTLIAYLALMIVFVSSKIVVGRRTHQQGMYIDLQTLAEMEQERDRLEREVRERQRQEEIDWRSIRNQASNENALNEKLRDDRGTNAAALNEAAAEAEARMRANREAYEQGLAEERAIRERRGKEDGAERQDRKVKGRVTVSFSITDPVRTSRYLEVPAYLCEGGGDVTVSVTVDRAGKVTGARVTERLQPEYHRLSFPRPKTSRQLLTALGLAEECALVARDGELLTPDRQIWPNDELLVRKVASVG